MRPLLLSALAAALTIAGACHDAPAPLGPGTGEPVRPVTTEEFDVLDAARWAAGRHPLGRGAVDPANVSVGGGRLSLALPAGRHDGAEIRSAGRVGHGSYSARMRTPRAPGSVSAFFLYEGVQGGNDEVDVEIFNDGSRRVMFTTWAAGRETHNATHHLPFDPADGFHEYRIEHFPGRVRFSVDGRVMREWRSHLPEKPMYLMANAWWPTWLSGPAPAEPRPLLIDRVRY